MPILEEMRSCDSNGDFAGEDLKCQPAPPTIPDLDDALEVEERVMPGTLVGSPIQGTTLSDDQAILWSIKPEGNNDGQTKDASDNFLPVFTIGLCDG